MSEASYALMLRNLSSDYYRSHLGIEEYRAQRKVILDKIDKDLNATEAVEEVPPAFMQTIGFFKNTDIES